MSTIWKLREPKINFHDTDFITDKILKIRGIEDTYSFLNPNETFLNPPELMRNMVEAVNKVIEAIFGNKRIGIYADVDADGVTSTAVIYRYLKNFTDNMDIIYHQRNEGHGILAKNCINKGYDMIIAVDSSTNSTKDCKLVTEAGIDIVVLDHHLKECENPYPLIVNPQLCSYPNKELSGVGVVYQFCRAFDSVMNTEYANNYIDIVAVGLIGDMMEVSSFETRYLIYEGIRKIRSRDKNLGIDKAMAALGKWYQPNATDIAFSLVPLINSSIRLGHVEWAIEMLISDDEQVVKEMVKQCNSSNKKRKKEQKAILERLEVDNSNSIIIIDATKNEIDGALRGLIANNIANTYQKPCLVVAEHEGKMQGSGRSYGSIKNFKDILSETGLFDSVVGHQGAFGVEFKKSKINKVHEVLNDVLANRDTTMVVEADMEIDARDISWQFVKDLEQLYFVCGKGFEEPTFIIRGLDFKSHKTMGDFDEHIKLSVDEDLEVVFFNGDKEIISDLSEYKYKDLVGKIGVNSWYHNGKKQMIHTMQIMAEDFK